LSGGTRGGQRRQKKSKDSNFDIQDHDHNHDHGENDDIIKEDKLQILLNLFGDQIRISYPFYDFEFLTGYQHEDGYKIKVTCNEPHFDKQLHKFAGHAKELPRYSDLRGGMLSSGILKLSNLEEFKSKLKSYRDLNKDVKFSLDTNLLYLRFLSNSGLIKPSEVVLVDTVGKEIKAKLNYKYNPRVLRAIKRSIKTNAGNIDELWNRRVKRSRKATYIALREYKTLLDGVADELEEVIDSAPDSRKNDIIIVKTLAQFESEGHTLPVLLTADDSMADLCNAEGVEYFKFDMPHIIEGDYCTIDQLLGLIFNLSVVLGFIQVNSVIVFGEFRGKSSNSPDELKIRYLDNRLKKSFQRDLRICRRLMELGIEK
jgi:hypothetical protein